MKKEDESELESRFIWWGASQISLWLIDFLSNDIDEKRVMKKTETIINILRFLCQNKADMLNLLYNSKGISIKMAPLFDKKGKLKTYMPFSIVWKGYSKKQIEKCEFISPQEHKFRDTARILADALNRACETLSLLTGRDKNEIFNSLIQCDIHENADSHTETPTQVRTKNTFFVVTEKDWNTMQQEKKAEAVRKAAGFAKLPVEERTKQVDCGFRVFKVEDISEYEAGDGNDE